MLGLTIMCPALTTIGLLEVFKRSHIVKDTSHIPWGQASLLFVWSFVYGAYSLLTLPIHSPAHRG